MAESAPRSQSCLRSGTGWVPCKAKGSESGERAGTRSGPSLSVRAGSRASCAAQGQTQATQRRVGGWADPAPCLLRHSTRELRSRRLCTRDSPSGTFSCFPKLTLCQKAPGGCRQRKPTGFLNAISPAPRRHGLRRGRESGAPCVNADPELAGKAVSASKCPKRV